jgi:hypothetical protein
MKKYSYPFLLGCILVLLLVLSNYQSITLASQDQSATIVTGTRYGGYSDKGDQRDADVYPAVAYDTVTRRYLLVWLTPRNAGSSSDGFDVYGIFLNSNGQPSGNEFRISDNNNVARNAFPAVVAGNGEFAVVWGAKSGSCKIYGQQVTDSTSRSDKTIVTGSTHNHTPSLVYNSSRQRYLLAFVEGNDYLPPTLFGADVDDCGNSSSSTSRIKALEFYFSNSSPVVENQTDISDSGRGAFRPQVAYSAGLNQYMITWEDRRNAGTSQYHFDVYAQSVNSNALSNGNDFSLATGGDYSNITTDVTWTPRPEVTASSDKFLAIWFTREGSTQSATWSVVGSLVSNGIPQSSFTVAQMTFVETTSAPTGFLSAIYSSSANEYLVGMTSHIESINGFISAALVQRVSLNGSLLYLEDGSVMNDASVGWSVDYDNDDQVGIALAVNSANYLVAYSRHAPDKHSRDFDIWAAKVQVSPGSVIPVSGKIYIPVVVKQPQPVNIFNGDFEQGATGWSEYSSNGWSLITQAADISGGITPHSGQWAAWLGGLSDETSYIRKQVTVPSNAPYLTYWHWIASADNCGYDFGGVGIDGYWYDKYDLCDDENTNGWVLHTVDLSAYAGQTISLNIAATTDDSNNSNLFVDDLLFQYNRVTAREAPQYDPTIRADMSKTGVYIPKVTETKQPPNNSPKFTD